MKISQQMVVSGWVASPYADFEFCFFVFDPGSIWLITSLKWWALSIFCLTQTAPNSLGAWWLTTAVDGALEWLFAFSFLPCKRRVNELLHELVLPGKDWGVKSGRCSALWLGLPGKLDDCWSVGLQRGRGVTVTLLPGNCPVWLVYGIIRPILWFCTSLSLFRLTTYLWRQRDILRAA